MPRDPMFYYGTVLSSNAAIPRALGDLAAQVCALAGSSDLDQTLLLRVGPKDCDSALQRSSESLRAPIRHMRHDPERGMGRRKS
jgi:hypothetical protein